MMVKIAAGTSVLLALAALAASGAVAAPVHRAPCHIQHACPSDHHTYTHKGLWCTSYPAERLVSDKKCRSLRL